MCIVKGVNIKIGKVDQKDKFVGIVQRLFSSFFFFQFNDLLRLLLFFLKIHCEHLHKTLLGTMKMLQVEVVRRKISFINGLGIYRVLLGNITDLLFLGNKFMVYDITLYWM